MRISLVSEHANPLAALGGVDAGGQNVHVAELARALAMRGHEVVVHTRREHPDQPEYVVMAPGVQVHHVTAGPAETIPKDAIVEHLPELARQLHRTWRRDRPDVVHAHFWMSGVASVEAAAPLRLPVAVTFHALGSVKRRHQGRADTSPASRLGAERSLVRTVDLVLATSTHEVEELESMGAERSRVEVVPCGVDVSLFRPDGAGRLWNPRRPMLLSLGRLVPRKGIDDAIRMLAHLPECELVVAGGPPRERLADDPEAQRLLEVAERAGVGSRVTFLGAVGRTEVPDLIRSADVVVCLPWYEPFGLVPLEAMACGTPVVGSRVGGLVDTIEDGSTGWLVEPRDPAQAAAAVRRLLASPGLLRAMQLSGPERAAEQFSWESVAARTERAYERIRSESAIRAITVPRARPAAQLAGRPSRPLGARR